MPNLITRNELLTPPATDDWVHIVDVSDTNDDPDGSDKRMRFSNFQSGINPLAIKGELITYSTAVVTLAVGADNQILTADSTAATGLAWKNSATLTNVTVNSTFTLNDN